jgi:hypothetical protein
MSMTKILFVAASLAIAAPLGAQASASFQDCSYNTSLCYGGENVIGKKVVSYGQLEGMDRADFNIFDVAAGKGSTKVLVPSTKVFEGNEHNYSN